MERNAGSVLEVVGKLVDLVLGVERGKFNAIALPTFSFRHVGGAISITDAKSTKTLRLARRKLRERSTSTAELDFKFDLRCSMKRTA